MSEPRDGTTQADVDFPLWRLLDHTRYMIFRMRERELAGFSLTPEQAFVLDIIHASGGSTTINRIVEMSQHRHNSISALINRMAKQGLLKKNRTRRDKRAFRIVSTAKGEELLGRASRGSVHDAFSCLELGEKRQLEALLNRLMVSAYSASGVSLPDFPPPSGNN